MIIPQIPCYEPSGGCIDRVALVEQHQAYGRSVYLETPWPQGLPHRVRFGSGGVVVLVVGYGPYVPHVGTSSSVVDQRSMARPPAISAESSAANPVDTSALRAALSLSTADQAREVLAALSLNKTQLAEVLGVSRPTLYDWLDEKEPNASNAQRLVTLLRVLVTAGVTGASPLNARFVRQPLTESGVSLLDALRAETLDEQLVSALLREAQLLGEKAATRRASREERLRSLGFETPSDDEQSEQLARNAAMRDWPKI